MTNVEVSREDRILELKRLIVRFCEDTQVEVNFMTNRRETDMVVFMLHGNRDQVLAIPAKIEEALKDEALELINTKQSELHFSLHLVLTVDLEEQATHSPEKRAKLLKNF